MVFREFKENFVRVEKPTQGRDARSIFHILAWNRDRLVQNCNPRFFEMFDQLVHPLDTSDDFASASQLSNLEVIKRRISWCSALPVP